MSNAEEKRMVQNYEITHGIEIGDKEVLFGIDEKNEMPYFCGFYQKNFLFGEYSECIVCDDYVEIMEEFAKRIKEQCIKVREEQAKVTIPRGEITADMCIPLSECGDIAGKVMVVRTRDLRPEYRSVEHQLIYVTSGNGTRKEGLGTACYCTELYSGNDTRWEWYNLQGEIKEECLPQWAKERLEEIKEQKMQTKRLTQDRSER